jgi:hypothetical protein
MFLSASKTTDSQVVIFISINEVDTLRMNHQNNHLYRQCRLIEQRAVEETA